MTTYVGSAEAARLLGVTKPTLYAYVSRGLVARRTAVDGRTSLYDRDQLEALVSRSRRRAVADRPSIDVRIATAITHLDDAGVVYRDHDAIELASTATFEQVAELLWTGELPGADTTWRADRRALTRCRALLGAAEPADPIVRLLICASALANEPHTGATPADATPVDATPVDAGRRFLALAPSILGGPTSGSIAARLAAAWTKRPSDALVSAVDRSLVLLADHELASSTLAVRVAASVRSDPLSAIVAGLATLRGALHGAASNAVAIMFDEARTSGATAAVARRLSAGERLPGFGHTVYRNGDPRLAPILDAVRELPDPAGRTSVVDSVIAEAGRSVGVLPNVDLGLGALIHVGRLPRDAPLFAVARIAGFVAHYVEEIGERPVRFRGLATRVER